MPWGVFYEWLKARKISVVGAVPMTGYNFTGSMALVKGKLVGLAVDEEFESHLTGGRVTSWVKQLTLEFGL